jgi:hypothetical protein
MSEMKTVQIRKVNLRFPLSLRSHPGKSLDPISPSEDMDRATITKTLIDEFSEVERWICALFGRLLPMNHRRN